MRLLLVRHGQTPSNAAAVLDTAPPGADLDAAGRRQAEGLVSRLAGEPIEAIYASDLVRTQQTAAPLAARRGLEVHVLGRLREIQAGAEEMSKDWTAYVGVLQAWATGTLDASNPGGENAHDFFSRYDEAVTRIAAAGHRCALLVSHGAALRMWLGRRVAGLTAEDATHRVLGNAAVVTIEGEPDAWRLVSWHEGEHAAGPEEDALDRQVDATAS